MTRKMYFSILVLLILAMLFPGPIVSQTLHETFGVIFGIMVLIHIITHFEWIKRMTKQLKNPKIHKEMKIMYVLNILLLLSVFATISTGVMMSQSLFKSISVFSVDQIKDIHEAFRLLIGLLVLAHLYLQRKKILMIYKKTFKK